MRDYELHTATDPYGNQACQIVFTPPLGNTYAADLIARRALARAKSKIRRKLQEASKIKLPKLSYFISGNRELSTGQLSHLFIVEGQRPTITPYQVKQAIHNYAKAVANER
jgi:hypothetical protein